MPRFTVRSLVWVLQEAFTTNFLLHDVQNRLDILVLRVRGCDMCVLNNIDLVLRTGRRTK